MLEKDLGLKVFGHDFLFILLYWRQKKNNSQAPNLAQLNTSKTEKNKNSTLLHLLKGTLLNTEGIIYHITLPR